MNFPKFLYAIPADHGSVLDANFFAYGLKKFVSGSGIYPLPDYSRLGCAERISGNQYRFLGEVLSVSETYFPGLYR